MKRVILLCAMLMLIQPGQASPAPAQAVQVSMTFNFASAAQRDAALLDIAKIYVLDIYSDTVRDANGVILSMGTTVQANKVLPAVRDEIARQMKEAVVNYRAGLAGKAASASSKTSENAALNP